MLPCHSLRLYACLVLGLYVFILTFIGVVCYLVVQRSHMSVINWDYGYVRYLPMALENGTVHVIDRYDVTVTCLLGLQH